jgi:t-SNARE complex subunit (syntaxin)
MATKNNIKEPEKLTYDIIADLIIEREETLLKNYKDEVIDEIRNIIGSKEDMNSKTKDMWDFFGMVKVGRFSISLTYIITVILLIVFILVMTSFSLS